MMNILTYLFWPNPGDVAYSSPKVLALVAVCVLLIVASVVLRFWRRGVRNQILRRLSRSWSTSSMWFGIVGLILIVSRAETVQYLSMRFLWVLWVAAMVLYVALQMKLYRMRYYEVLPTAQSEDPREKYLPKAKKK